MVRLSVLDTDVHQFRRRIEDFSRRQMAATTSIQNPRKRPSQAEDDYQTSKIQRYDLSSYNGASQRPRTIIPLRDQVSQDEISHLALPSPALDRYGQHSSDANRNVAEHGYQYIDDGCETPLQSFHERQLDNTQHEGYQRALVTSTTDQFGDVELLSHSSSQDSEHAWSSPSTPEDPAFMMHAFRHDQSSSVMLSLDALEEHERNLVMAFAAHQKNDIEFDLQQKSRQQMMQSPSDQYQVTFDEFVDTTW